MSSAKKTHTNLKIQNLNTGLVNVKIIFILSDTSFFLWVQTNRMVT
jgi:hypothetical protein